MKPLLILILLILSTEGVFANDLCIRYLKRKPTASRLAAAPVLSREVYRAAQLAIVDSLVASGLITEEERNALVINADSRRISQLHLQRLISDDVYESIIHVFAPVVAGQRTSAIQYLEFTPKESPENRSVVAAQNRYGTEGGDAIALLDPSARYLIAEIDFSVFGSELAIHSLTVNPRHRGFGYSLILLRVVLDQNPQIRKIRTTLSGDNERVFEEAIANGLTAEE